MPKSRPKQQPAASGDAIPIDAMLREMGFDTPAARKQVRAALEAAGLTNPRKTAMSLDKRERAAEAIASALVRVCGADCAALAVDGRTPVIVGGVTCEICAGSNNRRAALEAAAVLDARGITRVLIVGGSPPTRKQLSALLSPLGIELEMVEGTVKHSQKVALERMNRAQAVVIWGATELDHAVSELYTAEPPPHVRVIPVARRGVAALCDALRISYSRG